MDKKLIAILLLLFAANTQAQVSQKPLPGQDLNNAFTGNNTISNLNGDVYLDGVKYATLAAAVAALPSGGTLHISAGTYTVTASLAMVTNLDIECSPNNATILQASASLNVPMIVATSVNNWRIAGCVIDGNSPTNSNQFSAVQTTTSSGFKIIDNHFQNFNSRVLNISSGSSNFRIEGNEINNYGQPLPAALNGQEAIALAPVGAANGVQDGIIAKNYIHDGNGGVALFNSTAAPSAVANTSGNQVIDNRIRALANDAIVIASSSGTSSGSLIRQNTIARNIIRCTGWPANGTGWDTANCPAGTKQTGASASSSGVGIDIISATADQNTIAENHSDFNFFEGGDDNATTHSTVNTSNGALGACAANCVQVTSGDNLLTTWKANQGVLIGAAQFLISSVQSGTILTLTTAPGTQTGVALAGGVCTHDIWKGNFFFNNGNGAALGGQGSGLAIQGCEVTSANNTSINNAFAGFNDQIAAFVKHDGDTADSDCRIQNCQEFFAQAALNPAYQSITTNARVNSWGLWFDLNTSGAFGESPSVCSVNGTCGSANVTDNGTSNRFSDGRVRGAGAGSASLCFLAGSGSSCLNYGGGVGSFTANTPSLAGTMPVVLSSNGTQTTGAVHIVQDTATLAAGTVTVTLTGSAVFTSATSYTCVAKDTTTPANAASCAQTSGTSITITGTGTDVVRYILIGN